MVALMNNKIDGESLKKLRAVVESVPKQSGERSEKARRDLAGAVERLEREGK
jgi:hypothetical protein